MTNEMKETLRQLELFLTKQQASSPEPTRPPESDKNEVEAARLCLMAQFFQQQPYSELNKPCLLAKRSEIQAACKSQSLDFAEIEKLAESKMSKSVCDFYRKCNSDQSSPAPKAKVVTETPLAKTQKSLNPELTGKHFLAIGLIGLFLWICWAAYSHHKATLQAEKAAVEAYFNEEETFQLPAVNGVNTSFKDSENAFRDYCSQNNQSVSVKTIELAIMSQDRTRQVDDRISSSEVAQSMAHGNRLNLEDVATINRYNAVARHGTVKDGTDIGLGVKVSITHRVRRKSSDGTTPLSVEWLCPDPSITGKIPSNYAATPENIAIISASKHGIKITHTERYGSGKQEFVVTGLVGKNEFQYNLGYSRHPAWPNQWNGGEVEFHNDNDGEAYVNYGYWHPSSKENEKMENYLPEVETLRAWIQDYRSQLN